MMTQDEYRVRMDLDPVKKQLHADRAQLKDFSIKAMVEARYLTASPQWNMFLSWLEEARKDAKQAGIDASKNVFDPFKDPEVMRKEIIRQALANERVKVLEWVMGLPRMAIENGEMSVTLGEMP